MNLMSRISRICAWILLAVFALYVITGFDIPGRFLSPQLSTLIHLKLLLLPAVLAFSFHASYAMSQAFKRWKWKQWLSIAFISLFLALNAAFVGYYVYIQFIKG